jgi:NAD kinase
VRRALPRRCLLTCTDARPDTSRRLAEAKESSLAAGCPLHNPGALNPAHPLLRAAFDGKHPCRIHRGGAIRIHTSLCPLPLINKNGMDADWYEGITQKLKW